MTKTIRRGLIRYMTLAVDCSASLLEKDMRPNRLHAVKECTESFISQYFDQNPISQMSVIATADRSSIKLTELSGNPKHHLQAVSDIGNSRNLTPKGVPSIQSVLITAMGILRHIPDYGHRELLLIFSSLSTCDAGDVFKTIEEAKSHKIRCSVICLAAEVYVCNRLAQLTGGSFSVCLDGHHLRELLMAHVTPPPELRNRPLMTTKFVFLGFPKRIYNQTPVPCQDGSRLVVQAGNSFQCPRCKVRNTQLPIQCHVCGLQLYSSSHIARSYHHMFPVPNFIELSHDVAAKSSSSEDMIVNGTGIVANTSCAGCNETLIADKSLRLECPKCNSLFCVECDIFIHDSLHNCPVCC
jgi:transcription initiation factor TFIIH subunit 2